MNKTLMTREDIKKTYAESSDLGQLFTMLEKEFSERGEVICQFRLNGMNLTEADEQRLSMVGVQDVDFIEIDSESPTALLFGLMENWILELPKLLENTDLLAKEIRFKGIEGHLKSFVELIDSCQFLMDSLLSLEKVVQGVQMDTPIWHEAQQLTARSIGQALKVFEQKDFVLLAEILEYDLAHSLQLWLEQIRSLNRVLREENAKDTAGFSDRIFQRQG
jgi:hypothetical protein